MQITVCPVKAFAQSWFRACWSIVPWLPIAPLARSFVRSPWQYATSINVKLSYPVRLCTVLCFFEQNYQFGRFYHTWLLYVRLLFRHDPKPNNWSILPFVGFKLLLIHPFRSTQVLQVRRQLVVSFLHCLRPLHPLAHRIVQNCAKHVTWPHMIRKIRVECRDLWSGDKEKYVKEKWQPGGDNEEYEKITSLSSRNLEMLRFQILWELLWFLLTIGDKTQQLLVDFPWHQVSGVQRGLSDVGSSRLVDHWGLEGGWKPEKI